MAEQRIAQKTRTTKETDISIGLGIDGKGRSKIDTGIPFFDHMLDALARHSVCDMEIIARGDIEVDYHHTVEDVGILLGQCFKQALGDKLGIRRYGWSLLPMDDTLARVAIDLCDRPYLVFNAPENVAPIRDFQFQLVEEFMRGFTNNIGANLHIEILHGRDAHHMAEAIFKGLAKALDLAIQVDERIAGRIPSTKEML